MPPTFGKDLAPGDMPVDALVPRKATAADEAFADTPEGQIVVVTFALGSDPFAQEHGLVVWRRSPGDSPPWRAVYGFADPPDAGVLGITVELGDATGDGSPDALTFESTGGSGACGRYRLVDLSAAASAYERDVCDATIHFSTHPVGLLLREALFAPGDPHCCPSSFRVSQLEWNGKRFEVTSKEVIPAG